MIHNRNHRHHLGDMHHGRALHDQLECRHRGGTTTTRKMAGTGPATGSTVDYKPFSDSAHTLNWGNTVGEIVSRTGTGSQKTIDVYGRVPPQTAPPAGTYTDTVSVTVTY